MLAATAASYGTNTNGTGHDGIYYDGHHDGHQDGHRDGYQDNDKS